MSLVRSADFFAARFCLRQTINTSAVIDKIERVSNNSVDRVNDQL
jgi:hypothetical protein